MVIDPHVGALIESSRGIELGPPKTAESARTITLPPFLVDLLRRHLASHGQRFVFVTPSGEPHRNSNFGRRALRPAVDGTLHRARAVVALEPVKPGLTFHGLRHGHKTWMIADGVPEVAQARRLGHILGDRIQRDLLPRRRRSRHPPARRAAGPLGQSRRRQRRDSGLEVLTCHPPIGP